MTPGSLMSMHEEYTVEQIFKLQHPPQVGYVYEMSYDHTAHFSHFRVTGVLVTAFGGEGSDLFIAATESRKLDGESVEAFRRNAEAMHKEHLRNWAKIREQSPIY